MPVRVAAIYRVSTERQVHREGGPDETIPVQRQAVHDFVAAHRGWQLVAEYAEEGVSGYKVSADDRDILQQAFQDARQGRFELLVTYKADRLSRNSLEYPLVLARFQKLGVEVWSVKDAAGGKKLGFDNQTDKLIRFIEGWQAETESYNTSVRVAEAMTQMARRGEWTGGRVPYGYQLQERVRKKGRRAGPALAIVESEAESLRLMARLYLEGWGSKRIAEHLNTHGIRTKEGRPWRDAGVRRVLQNPLIAGLPAYQRTRPSSTGRSRVWKAPDLEAMIIPRDGEGRPAPSAELEILPLALWQQVMAAMRHNRPQARGPSPYPKAGRQMESEFLLTGLIRCGHCGEGLVGYHNYRTHTLADGRQVRYKKLFYICNGHRQMGAAHCSGQRTYSRRKVEETVMGELQLFLQGLDLDELRGLAQDSAAASAEAREQELARLEAELERACRVRDAWLTRLDAYFADPGGSPYTEAVLAQKARAYTDQAGALTARITVLREAQRERALRDEQLAALCQLLPAWWEVVRAAETRRKKLLLGQLIAAVRVFRTHLEIEYAVALDALVGATAELAATRWDGAPAAPASPTRAPLGQRQVAWPG